MYSVSVIMPVYNNERTLNDAIRSILKQTIYDFELILINDGSTDASGQICNAYAKMEPLFVEVIHQQKSGFVAARNKGLAKAGGNFVYFADAQDTYHKKMLENNVNLAEERKADLVVFGFSAPNENNDEKHVQQLPSMPFLSDQEQFRNHYRNFHHFFPYVLFNKLYRRSFLFENRIKFYNTPLREDAFFNLRVSKDLNSVVFNRSVYCYQNRKNEIEEKQYIENQFETDIELAKYFEAMIEYWDAVDEFQDLITLEYFNAVHEELLNITNKNPEQTLEEQEKNVDEILADKRVAPYVSSFKDLKEKSPYKAALVFSLQNGNSKAALQLVNAKNNTTTRASRLFGFLKAIFRR